MLRRLGKRRGRMSLLSWMDARLLLAITRVSRLGNMEPNLRTSDQSLRLLSVMWSRRREGQATLEALTLLYSLRHRNNSSSLQVRTQRQDSICLYASVRQTSTDHFLVCSASYNTHSVQKLIQLRLWEIWFMYIGMYNHQYCNIMQCNKVSVTCSGSEPSHCVEEKCCSKTS